jgi:hypothetical protein
VAKFASFIYLREREREREPCAEQHANVTTIIIPSTAEQRWHSGSCNRPHITVTELYIGVQYSKVACAIQCQMTSSNANCQGEVAGGWISHCKDGSLIPCLIATFGIRSFDHLFHTQVRRQDHKVCMQTSLSGYASLDTHLTCDDPSDSPTNDTPNTPNSKES